VKKRTKKLLFYKFLASRCRARQATKSFCFFFQKEALSSLVSLNNNARWHHIASARRRNCSPEQREQCHFILTGFEVDIWLRRAEWREAIEGKPFFFKKKNQKTFVLSRNSRMSADFLVQEGRICNKYQRVIVNEGARRWNTQRVTRMMGLCGSISTGD